MQDQMHVHVICLHGNSLADLVRRLRGLHPRYMTLHNRKGTWDNKIPSEEGYLHCVLWHCHVTVWRSLLFNYVINNDVKLQSSTFPGMSESCHIKDVRLMHVSRFFLPFHNKAPTFFILNMKYNGVLRTYVNYFKNCNTPYLVTMLIELELAKRTQCKECLS